MNISMVSRHEKKMLHPYAQSQTRLPTTGFSLLRMDTSIMKGPQLPSCATWKFGGLAGLRDHWSLLQAVWVPSFSTWGGGGGGLSNCWKCETQFYF